MIHTVREGEPNFLTLRNALLDGDFGNIDAALNAMTSIELWSAGLFKVVDGKVVYNGEPLPGELTQRILAMVGAGDDPNPILRFWERLSKNPSMRSVEQLYPFLKHQGIPITPKGTFLAYKGVRSDYKDVHTGTIPNVPGSKHEMPRNKISDDPNTPCHYGFHVGALEYARSFGDRMVICEVDPEDVVCIPYDSSHRKMRVCKYSVIGDYGDTAMPDTVFDVDNEINDPDVDDDADDSDVDSSADTQGDTAGPVKDILAMVPQGTPVRSVSKKFRRLHGLDTVQLMRETTEDLRHYASKGLKIIGASRIPGGKAALIRKISSVRGF